MVTIEKYRQGAPRRACPYCDGHDQVTMGWPENVSWDANAYPCFHCRVRGWVADASTAPRASWRRRSRRKGPRKRLRRRSRLPARCCSEGDWHGGGM